MSIIPMLFLKEAHSEDSDMKPRLLYGDLSVYRQTMHRMDTGIHNVSKRRDSNLLLEQRNAVILERPVCPVRRQ